MISVIVPTRSRYKNLVNTLEALNNQTMPRSEYEIIVSDDNSTDETQSIINKFKDGGIFKYVFNNHKPHSWNASVPRNLGALVADPDTCGYIFIDSDVMVPNNTIQAYYDGFRLNPDRVIIGPYHWTNKDGNLAQEDVRWPKFQSVGVEETFSQATDGLACFGGNIFMPRDIFWRVKGFSVDTHIGLEDGDMGLKLWKSGVKFSYDRNVLGKHQWHETPSDRFPSNMREHINKLNMKHFGTTDPDYGIIETSREAYASWGITGWNPPAEWLENKLEFGLKVNTV